MPETAPYDWGETLQRAIETLEEFSRTLAAGVQETQVPFVTSNDTLDPEDEPIPKEEQFVPSPSTCGCESHKLLRRDGNKLRHAVIHEYSYRPRGSWKLKSVRNDPFDYYLGVELETDAHAMVPTAGRDREDWSRVLPSMAADMRRPKNLWVPKHDGSVTGPEFASHPATLTYWQRYRKQLEEMFQMLLHAGYRSHDNDTCGMHVNISRTAFTDAGHLFRWLTLLHANPMWALRMSQRTRDSAAHWANVETFTDVQRRARACGRVFRNESTGYDRYTCLNAPYDEPRFEFRLPRGTLRIDRFFKNLEWTVGMIEYTRNTNVKEATPANFMSWAIDNESQYPDLVNFIAEKFDTDRALQVAVPVEGNVPEDESSLSGDTRDLITIPFGGPVVYYDGMGTMRYAASRDRVRATDTFMGDDGQRRRSNNGLPAPDAPNGRPSTYTDTFGTMRYATAWNGHLANTRVTTNDTYLDSFGRQRRVLTDYRA